MPMNQFFWPFLAECQRAMAFQTSSQMSKIVIQIRVVGERGDMGVGF